MSSSHYPNIINNGSINRGRRFSQSDREAHGLVGLVHPAGPKSLTSEIYRLKATLEQLPNNLARYQFLLRVLADDEQLFFATTQNNFPQVLPLIYTPTVGLACQKYSSLDLPLRGLWLDINYAGRLDSVLANWPAKQVDVVVVSDCERILGLGDLGANGMGIPVGKLLLYSACGGVDPNKCLPVVLDVGCNTPKIREDENYIGLQQDRVRGPKYDEFIQEFLDAVRRRYGKNTLIQFEDFGNANAQRLLDKYRDDVCCFNDDIQGTAAVGLAGILSALRIPNVPSKLQDHSFVFLGAGSAGIGIASLIVLALVREGISEEEARRKCWFLDSRGLVYNGRSNVSEVKKPFAHEASEELKSADGLLGVIKVLKPTAIIGVSTIQGSFTPEIIQEMGKNYKRPLIFALSNPTSKAECTAEEAYFNTNGRAIYASGSPFAPVSLPEANEVTPGIPIRLVPGQGNNSYIFPGLGLGVVLSQARTVPESMLLAAADCLAKLVDNEQLSVSCVYPDLTSLMDISAKIAYAVCQEAKHLGVNDNKEVDSLNVEKIREIMYEPGRGLVQ